MKKTHRNLFSDRESPREVYDAEVEFAEQSEQKQHFYLIKGRRDRPNLENMSIIDRIILSIVYS